MALKDCIRKMEKAGAPISADQQAALQGFLDVGMTDEQAVRAVILQSSQNVVDIAHRARNEGAVLAPAADPVTELVQFQAKALEKLVERSTAVNEEILELNNEFMDSATVVTHFRHLRPAGGRTQILNDISDDTVLLDLMVQKVFARKREPVDFMGLKGTTPVELFNSFRALEARRDEITDRLLELKDEGDRIDARQHVIEHGKKQTFYQQGLPDRLMVRHNLTSENLTFTDELGGFAIPSMAVTKEGASMTGFGEITLIGTIDLADPKAMPLYDADGYTVRFPSAEYSKAKAADRDGLWRDLLPYTLQWEDQSSLGYQLDQTLRDATVPPQTLIWHMLENPAVKAKFLREEHGEDLTPTKQDVTPGYEWGWDPELLAFFTQQNVEAARYAWEDPRRKNMLKRAAKVVERVAKRSLAKRLGLPVTHDRVQVGWQLAGMVNTDGTLPETKFAQLRRSAEEKGAVELDHVSNTDMLNARMDKDNRRNEFKDWVEAQILPMVGEARLKIGGKWVPYNLENIVRKMKGKLQGTEFMDTAMTEGLMRALVAHRFKALEEMRARSELIMDEREEVDLLRAAAQEKMTNWLGEMAQFYVHQNAQGYVDAFEAGDDGRRAVIRWATSKDLGSAEDLRTELERKGFDGMPDWLVDEGLDAAMTWMAVPVPYFEGKPQRAVMFEEFAGAVIPMDASPETRAILTKRGIPYREYQIGRNIDENQTRTDAVTEFTQILNDKGERTLFQSEIGFTSGLLTAAQTMPREKGTVTEMMGTLKKQPNVKKQELEWLGVEEWMMSKALADAFGQGAKGQPYSDKITITRDELVAFIEAGGIQVQEAVYAGERADERINLEFDGIEMPEEFADPEFSDPEDINYYTVRNRHNAFSEIYTVVEDYGAGNVSVRRESTGEWLDIEGLTGKPINRQDRDDASDAIVKDMENYGIAPGAKGYAKWTTYTLPGGTNHTERVLHLPEQGGYNFTMDDLEESHHPNLNSEISQERELAEQETKRAWYIDAFSPMATQQIDGTSQHRRVQTFQIKKSDFPTIEEAKQYIIDHKPVEGPARENVTSHAFPEKNIMAWIRSTDRVGPNGERILFIEEIQSDLHQAGQSGGYRLPKAKLERLQGIIDSNYGRASLQLNALDNFGLEHNLAAFNAVQDNADWKDQFGVDESAGTDAVDRWREAIVARDESAAATVPEFPFKGDAWGELAIKRIIRIAAEQGYDQIAWTTGEQQNERYSLAEQYSSVQWDPRSEMLQAYDLNGRIDVDMHITLGDLHTAIGAEPVLEIKKQMDEAERSLSVETAASMDINHGDLFVRKEDRKRVKDGFVLVDENGEIRRDTGGDFVIYDDKDQASMERDDLIYEQNIPEILDLAAPEGKSMKQFYDKLLVNVTNRASRKLDKKAKVKMVPMEDPEASDLVAGGWIDQPGLDITPDIQVMAQEGMTLFQDRNRAEVTFDAQGRAMVRLSESKDLSSFLHETAHIYLELMGDLAEMPDASERVINDYAKMLTYLGVNHRREITTAHHERLAESFEAYLREGKSPTAELQPQFTEIKGWMIRIYKQIEKLTFLGAGLDDEIRGVFDRMVATDAQIAASEDYMGYVALYSNAEEMGVTPRAFEVYRSLMNESHDEAVDHETKKMLKAMLWGQQQWWKDELAKIATEVRAEAEAMPVYQALAALQKHEAPDGTALVTNPVKLDKADLIRRYGKDFIKRLSRPWVYAAEGGTDADYAAKIWGFNSGNELVQALIAAPSMEEFIKAEANRRMQDLHPDPLSSPEMADEATRAVHNEKRGRIIAAELKALRRQVKADAKIVAATKKDIKEQDKQALAANEAQLPKREDYAHIKEAAKQSIAGKRIRDVNPNTYLQAERKAGRLSREAMKRKDYAESARQKRIQIMNYEAYRAAVRAKAQSARDQKYLKTFEKQAKRQKMGKAGVLEQIDAVLDGINFRKISGAQIDRENLHAEMLVAVEAGIADGSLVVPHEVLKSLKTPGGINWQEMTFEEFAGVRDVVKQLEHQAKTQLEIIINGERRVVQDAVDAVAASIVANHDVVVIPRGEGGAGRKAMKSVRQGIGHWLRSSSIARILDQSGFGAVTRQVIEPIRRAYTEKLYPRIQTMTEDLAGIFKAHYTNEEMGRLTKPIEMEGEKYSKSDILALGLNWGSETNRAAVLGGVMKDAMGNKSPAYTQQEVDALLSRLDARDWAFIQDMWDYQDTYYPEMAATEQRRRGIAPTKVEALSFEITTSDGQTITVRGGYHPLQYNPEHGGQVSEKEFEDYFNRVTNGTYVSANTRAGATYERVRNHGKVVLLSLNTIDRNLREVIRDITIGDEVNLVRRILTHEDVTNAARNTGNRELVTELGLWLSDAAVGELPAQSVVEKGLSWIRVGFTKSKLAFNVFVTALQLTGAFQSMAVIGAGNYMRGVGKFVTNPMGNYKHVMETSAFMNARYGVLQTWDKDVQDTNNFLSSFFGPTPTKFKGKLDTLGHWYFKPIAIFQSVIDVTTWMGAYEKGLNELELNEADAKLYADTQVEAAQTSGLFSDRSGIERGTLGSRTRQGQFVRLWTTLISYMLAKGNIAYEKGVALKKKPTLKGAVELATDYALLFMIEGMASALLYGMGPGEEDEDESIPGWIAKVTVESMASGIPGVREYSAAKYGSGQTPVGAFIVDGYKMMQQLEQGEVDEAAVKSVVKVTGTLFHLPSSQTNRAVEAMMSDDDVALYEYFTGTDE